MFINNKKESWIGKRLGDLPDEIIIHAHREGRRPTVRALPYEPGHKKNQRVASFQVAPKRLTNPSHQVFTTIGGGVERGFGWVAALYKEFYEELRVVAVTEHMLARSPIVAMETVASTRRGCSGKVVVVVGVPMNNLHPGNLQPTGDEITGLHIGTICDTVQRVRQLSRHTPQEMVSLYLSALTQLRRQLSGQTC